MNNEPKSGYVECPCCNDIHMVNDWLVPELCGDCLDADCSADEYAPQCDAHWESWA